MFLCIDQVKFIYEKNQLDRRPVMLVVLSGCFDTVDESQLLKMVAAHLSIAWIWEKC
jgi:hypothetical protein